MATWNNRSVSSKGGVSHNITADDLVGLSNMSDYDISVNKSATIAGQDCNVNLGMSNIKTVRLKARSS